MTEKGGHAVLDRERLREAAGDDIGIIRELLRLFREDAEAHVANLKKAKITADRALLLEVTHSLKGASANVGAREVERQAQALYYAIRSGEVPNLPERIDSLISAVLEIREDRYP